MRLDVFVGQGFGEAHTALDFGLEITAEIFGDDAGSGEFAKIRNGEMRQEGEDSGERRVGIADEREAHIVGLRPFAMIGDRLDDAEGSLFARQSFQNLGFREEGIIESNGEDVRVAFSNERARNARRAAASEGNFLAEGQLREARYDLVFGNALEFRGGDGGKRELNEIHEVDIANQTQANEARRAGMEEQGTFDDIALKQILARADVFEHFGGKILAG